MCWHYIPGGALLHWRWWVGSLGPTDSKVYGRQKREVKILCVAAELKNRGQKSICGHKKGGQYSMSHWKTGVKILRSKSWEGQNSMKAKIWGSKFYFFLVEPLVKILCSLKRGVKILYFFPVPWKRGVKTAEPTNQLHWRGAPPRALYRRVAGMPENTIVKQVFMALYNLHNQGFRTWVSKVKDIAEKYNVDIDEPTVVISDVNNKLNNFFMDHWWSRIQNLSRFPKLEWYKNIKHGFHFETYLDLVKDSRYRNARAKIRSSSHPLEIERGRYTKPKTPRSNRLCSRCKVIEDERHFILECTLYKVERHIFLCKVSNKNPMFPALTTEEKLVYLLASKDARILTWMGKFLYHIFDKRNKYLS